MMVGKGSRFKMTEKDVYETLATKLKGAQNWSRQFLEDEKIPYSRLGVQAYVAHFAWGMDEREQFMYLPPLELTVVSKVNQEIYFSKLYDFWHYFTDADYPLSKFIRSIKGASKVLKFSLQRKALKVVQNLVQSKQGFLWWTEVGDIQPELTMYWIDPDEIEQIEQDLQIQQEFHGHEEGSKLFNKCRRLILIDRALAKEAQRGY